MAESGAAESGDDWSRCVKNWVPTDTPSTRPTLTSTGSPGPNSMRTGISGAPRTSPAGAEPSGASLGAHASASAVSRRDSGACALRGTASAAITTLSMGTDRTETRGVTVFHLLPARRFVTELVPRTRSSRTRREVVRNTGPLRPADW